MPTLGNNNTNLVHIDNRPLIDYRHDELDRQHSVNYVISLLRQQQPIGEKLHLAAPVGSGRTTLLNFIKNKFDEGYHEEKENTGKTVHLLQFNCSYLTNKTNTLAYLARRIFNQAMENNEIKSTFLDRARTKKIGKKENKLSSYLFPEVETETIREQSDSRFSDKNDMRQLMEELHLLNTLTAENQWLLLIDNYDRLDAQTKGNFSQSLEILHDKIHNIISVLAVDDSIENTDEQLDSFSSRNSIKLPSMTGLEKNIKEKYINELCGNYNIEISERWYSHLIEDGFKDNLHQLKHFLNSLLAHPSSGTEKIPWYLSWYLNPGDSKIENQRANVHFSRLASMLLLRDRYPEYFNQIAKNGEKGYLQLLRDIHSKDVDHTSDHQKAINSFKEHFSPDFSPNTQRGFASPFFTTRELAPYLTLRFEEHIPSNHEQALQKWNQDLGNPIKLVDRLTNTTEKSINAIAEDIIGEETTDNSNLLDKYQNILWIAKALYSSYFHCSESIVTQADLKPDDILLRNFRITFDLTSELVNRSLENIPIDVDVISDGSVNFEQENVRRLFLLKELLLLKIDLIQHKGNSIIAANYINFTRQHACYSMYEEDISSKFKSIEEAMESRNRNAVNLTKNSRYDVFISHRNDSRDDEVASSLKGSLIKKGISGERIYLYKEEDKAGKNWQEQLFTALAHSRSFFLVLSDGYMQFRGKERDQNWTHTETAAARFANYNKNALVFWTYVSDNPVEHMEKYIEESYRQFGWITEIQATGNGIVYKQHQEKRGRKNRAIAHQLESKRQLQIQTDELATEITTMLTKQQHA